jgi:hypothetical protein
MACMALSLRSGALLFLRRYGNSMGGRLAQHAPHAARVCTGSDLCTRFALWEKSSAMKDGSQQFLDTVKAYNERQAKKKWYEI